MRIFYALTFSKEDQHKIKTYQDQLRPLTDLGRFTDSENFHMTLAFIGQIDPKDLEAYKQSLRGMMAQAMTLHVNGFGSFKKKNRHILWLSIDNHPQLRRLNSRLVKKLNLETEDFIAHITLARQAKLNKSLSALDFECFDLKVQSLALMESKRVDNQLRYVVIEEVTFYKTDHSL